MDARGLAAVRDPADVGDRAVVSRFYFIRIFNDLVYEVAKMQHEAELILGPGAFVLEDHSAIGVELPLVDVLTADESEVHGPRVVRERSGDGAADAAAVAVRVGEPVPIDARRLEPADQHPRGPVGRRRNRGLRFRDDAAELLVFGDLDVEHLPLAFVEGPAGPQQYAVRPGIARRDTLRKKIAPFPPVQLGTRARWSA